MRVAIIGAGPTGLAAAYSLSKRGNEVDLYEASANIGGLASSFDLWNRNVELGPHFFSYYSSPIVRDVIFEMLGHNLKKHKKVTKIINNDRFFRYPPDPIDMLSQFGLKDSVKSLISLLEPKRKTCADNYKDLSINTVGEFAYEYFFRAYAEKIWNIPCEKISDSYLKRLTGYNEISNPAKKLINAILKTKKNDKGKYYIYPYGGVNILWERVCKYCESMKCNIYLNTPIKQLILDKNAVTKSVKRVLGIQLNDGVERHYEKIIVTLPNRMLPKILPQFPKRETEMLRNIHYRSVISVYLNVSAANRFSEQVLYLFDRKFRATKITNFNNFGDSKNYETQILLLEYWCDKDDDLWALNDSGITEIALADLQRINLLKDIFIHDSKIFRAPNVYPVPDLGYYDKITAVNDAVSEYENLYYVGRGQTGHFNYGMEECMEDALELVKDIPESVNSI